MTRKGVYAGIKTLLRSQQPLSLNEARNRVCSLSLVLCQNLTKTDKLTQKVYTHTLKKGKEKRKNKAGLHESHSLQK